MQKQIIGMIHLSALPMAPKNKFDIDTIYDRAKQDLLSLEKNGASAAIIENFNDIPYGLENDKLDLYTMCAITAKLRSIATIPLGLNVQFNCYEDEIAMATACGVDFIRVEAYVENRVGSFGVIEACAAKIERIKKKYGSKVKIYADVNVKHSHPLVPSVSIEESLAEAIESGADAIIITGLRTGENPSLEDVKKVRRYSGNIPIVLGSGINKNNILEYCDYIDGAIVGTSFKIDGNVYNGIDGDRVKEFMDQLNNN